MITFNNKSKISKMIKPFDYSLKIINNKNKF